ncbi:MAG: MBL fold metallo-hydrolase [Treponemataceae bacterium]
MKIYTHLSIEGFSNCYIVGNEKTREALIIDPGKITKEILFQIEDNKYRLAAVLVTHKHKSHYRGLQTLQKIYHPLVYAFDYEIAGVPATVIKDDGFFYEAGLRIDYYSVPGHTVDSVVFKIEQVLFTGDTLTAGMLAKTNHVYAKQTLEKNVLQKLITQNDNMIVMPGHGPPSTIAAEKKINLSIGCPLIISQINRQKQEKD